MKQKPKDEKVINILNRLIKRVEEATVDIHSIKSDLKLVSLKLYSVETSVGIIKVDMERMKADIEGIKKDVQGVKADTKGLRTDVDIMRTDIGGMKKDIKDIKREVHDLTLTTAEILANMVTQEEYKSLSKRASSPALEHQ